MANQNFVVHNGLSVGSFEVNATTSNVTLPVSKQIAIGNVILRDNGDGKLHVRDITDNNDAEIVATVGAVSTTAGNIQIGTNHIESTNPNGPISLRPNGNGNIALTSNTIMIGHGGAYTLIGTGIQTDPLYGINYPGSNIILTMSNINSSGNLRLSMTTAATSTTTGALQVSGGIGVVGAVVAAQLNSTGNVLAAAGTFNALNVNGVINSTGNVLATAGTFNALNVNGVINSTGNVLATAGTFNSITVNGNESVTGYLNVTGNVLAKIGTFNELDLNGYLNSTGNVLATGGVFNALTVNGNETVTGYLNVTGNVIAAVTKVGSVESAGVIYANSTVASGSASTGAIVTAGGIGAAKDSVFGGNVTIAGNLFVGGNTTVISANNLIINDSMIYLADDNPADVLDIGIVSSFTNPGYQHTGIVRDATDGVWKLFANVTAEPTTNIDFTNATYSSLLVGNLLASDATVSSLAAGSGAITTSGTITAGLVNSTGNVLAQAGRFNALNIDGVVNSTGNLLATAGTFNALTVNGGITSTGFFNTSANVSAAIVRGATITATGTITGAQLNSTGNVLAQNGVLQTLTVNGELDSQNIVPLASNTYSVGSTTLWYTAFWGAAVNAQYADLAEKYIADAEYEPGTVLEFGGEYEVTICEAVMSSRVAGVVSTKPAYLMNHQITGNNVIDLALTGRVPTKVVGPVKKGDLMVSAGGGRARSEENPRVGSVIGKALEDFGVGIGVIEVVVGKH